MYRSGTSAQSPALHRRASQQLGRKRTPLGSARHLEFRSINLADTFTARLNRLSYAVDVLVGDLATLTNDERYRQLELFSFSDNVERSTRDKTSLRRGGVDQHDTILRVRPSMWLIEHLLNTACSAAFIACCNDHRRRPPQLNCIRTSIEKATRSNDELRSAQTPATDKSGKFLCNMHAIRTRVTRDRAEVLKRMHMTTVATSHPLTCW